MIGRALFFALSFSFVTACADDDGTMADTGPSPDSTVGDAAMDGAPDSGVPDAADSSTADAVADSSMADAGDATTDTSVDAGSCGALPACSMDEICWGEGCSCMVEIDGDSYLRADGQVYYSRFSPHQVAETTPGTPLTGIVEIMDGGGHTCGLKDDGTVWCWGKTTMGNDRAQLGNGTTGGATAMLATQVLTGPGTPLTGITRLSDRSASRCYIADTTCGIRGSDGAVFCWGGDNAGGGDGSFFTEGSVAARPYATQLMASDSAAFLDVEQVTLGVRHACAISTDGSLRCWGMNVTGSLGVGDQVTRQYPTEVMLPGGATADEVGAGGDTTCARSGDRVYCWGASTSGAVGLGDPMDPGNHDGCINYCKTTPVAVIDGSDAALTGVVDLEVAYQGACARLGDDSLRCWGTGVGQVATDPTIGGGMIGGVAAMTTCGSSGIPTDIRWVERDGTLHDATSTIDPVCP
jgi:hypothetical protein